MEGTVAVARLPLAQIQGAAFFQSTPKAQACINYPPKPQNLALEPSSTLKSKRTVCRSQVNHWAASPEQRSSFSGATEVLRQASLPNHALAPAFRQRNHTRAVSESASASVSAENGRPAPTASMQGPASPYFPNNEANIKVIGKAF